MSTSAPSPSSPTPLPVVVPNSLLQVAQQTGDLMAIVGFDVTLSQAEVPYVITPGVPVAASETDLVVYGDTVTITGDLVNPGRQIAIYARQIICGSLTFISTAGGDPVTDYQPGDPAQQTDNNSGAPGAGGGAGSKGLAAGALILAAESIQVQGADTGVGTAGRTICLGQLMPQVGASAQAVAISLSGGFSATPIAIPNQPITSLPGTTLTGISFNCSGAVNVTSVSWTGSAFLVILLQRGATFQSQLSNALITVPVNATLDLALTLSVVPAIGGLPPGTAPFWSVENIAVSTSSTGIPTLDAEIDACLAPAVTAAIQNSIAGGSLSAIATSLATTIANGILPAGGSPALVLLANGGCGGRGQDGHAGIVGATGAPGQAGLYGSMPPPYYPPGAQGGTGGQGGQGGNAGTSGPGGQGGTITVNVVQTSSPIVAAFAAGGVGGNAASAGAPGAGGPGGAGASWEYSMLSMPPQTYGAPSGANGPAGPAAAVQGALGAAGPDGSASLDGVSGQTSTYTYAQLANQLDLYQLIFTQGGAKIAYLNARSASDYQTVATLYTWLSAVTTTFQGGVTPPGCTFSSTDIATRAAIYTDATQELARLATGLDYYGEALNWVSVLTWTALNTFITQQLASMQAIQTELTVAEQISQQETAAQSAATSAQQDLVNLQAYEATVQAQINALSDQITALDTSVANQVFVVQQALIVVETALLAETGCPSISSLLATVSSIVSLGKDVMAAKSDIAAGLKVPGDAGTVYQNIKNLVVQIEAPEVDCSDIATAWNNLQTTLQTNGANSALILTDADKFTALVQKLCNGLNGTQTLINSINALVGLIQTRNQTVLNYSGQYMNLARLQTRYAQKSAELEHIAAVVAEGQQPQLPVYLAFLRSALTEMGNTIVRSVYQANQAFNYGMVQAQAFSVNGLDLASLSAAATSLETAVTNALICQGGAFQAFSNITYTATAADEVDAFNAFAATGVLLVQVPIDATIPGFTGNYNITVSNIAVSLTGITPPAGTVANPTVLDVDILQLGPDLKQAQGSTTVVAFTHAPRPLEYAWNYTTGVEMIDGTVGDATQGFAGLSPFAMWKFDFTPSAAWLTPALRAQVTGIELTFSGQLLPPPAARSR